MIKHALLVHDLSSARSLAPTTGPIIIAARLTPEPYGDTAADINRLID